MYVIYITALSGVIVIDYKLFAVIILLAIAVISDLRTYRIRNAVTFGFMLLGLVSNLIADGVKGMLFSAQGLLLPVICLLFVYMMRAVGAGDVKLLSAIGAFMGSGFVFDVILYTFLCGGIIAALLILLRRNGLARLRHLLFYIRGCILSMSLLEYSDLKERFDGSKFHFSMAVAFGTIMTMTMQKLGIAIL